MKRILQLLRDRSGATAIEYAMIASVISIAAIGAMISVGGQVDGMFNNVANGF